MSEQKDGKKELETSEKKSPQSLLILLVLLEEQFSIIEETYLLHWVDPTALFTPARSSTVMSSKQFFKKSTLQLEFVKVTVKP